MYDKHQLEKQVFVRNCFFHYASNKSCKLLTQTSSQDICSIANRSGISTIHVSEVIFLELLLVQSIAIRNLISQRFTAFTKGQPLKGLVRHFYLEAGYICIRPRCLLFDHFYELHSLVVGDYY